MEFEQLTDDNFLLYAAQNYQNPNCSGMEDFYSDLKHIKYVKRLLNRAKKRKDVKTRLILNHITILYNLFGIASTRMLYLKITKDLWPYLKPFLVHLSYQPEVIYGVTKKNITSSDIPLNKRIVDELREL